MQGWIKTHRSKLNWEWFTDYKTSHLFEYILLCASHNEYRHKGKIFKPGQMPFGYEKASQQTGLSVRMIRTSLDKLISTNEVTKQSSRQGTVITVVNWEKYQVETNDLTNKRQTTDKRTTSTNNVNNENNDNNIYKGDYVEPDTVIQLWNDTMPKHGYPYAKTLGSGVYIREFLNARRYLKTVDDWRELFTKVIESQGNVSKNDGWIINLNWLVNHDNALKIINGNFRRKLSDAEKIRKQMQDWSYTDD